MSTELNNKAETILQISRSKTDETVSEVSAAMIRAAEFDPFAFRINDYGLPEIASGYVFTEPGKKKITSRRITGVSCRKAANFRLSG